MSDDRMNSDAVDSLESWDEPEISIYEQVLYTFIKMYPNCGIVLKYEFVHCTIMDDWSLLN